VDKDNLTQLELIQKCLSYWNSLKRHRTLADIRKQEKRFEDSMYHQLQEYKMSELLELGLRALQNGQRDLEAEKDESIKELITTLIND
jgi:hypothetical protein